MSSSTISQETGEGAPFLAAVKEGKLGEVTALLASGAVDVNVADDQGRTALMLACAAGHDDICKVLLEGGADPDLEDKTSNKWLAIHHAANGGHCNALKLLLASSKPNLMTETEPWGPPLHVAARAGKEDACKLLIDAGADPRYRCRLIDARYYVAGGDTALHAAAYGGHLAIMRLLIDSGASVGASNYAGATAAHYAASANQMEACKIIFSIAGPDMATVADMDGCSPFLSAAASGSTEACRFLLSPEGFASPYQTENDRAEWKGALCLAAEGGHEETCRFLIEEVGFSGASQRFMATQLSHLLIFLKQELFEQGTSHLGGSSLRANDERLPVPFIRYLLRWAIPLRKEAMMGLDSFDAPTDPFPASLGNWGNNMIKRPLKDDAWERRRALVMCAVSNRPSRWKKPKREDDDELSDDGL